ncbi:uncharacterized protein F4807DRAFT_468794 [Annulohypoxylon truncatum]|uniref:uncharacterized protein n=1 Tax=Annulohypoxylon truncatum TaxID=327061 RepID=UPI0020084E51|nr:uncharacterized protein F4807DRAFT_468794 [Annulohypoxylon truncatum]KAI1208207.1 hypothetical protein F4807DRAFT_468794 [Annulohypoxylon truncatum]
MEIPGQDRVPPRHLEEVKRVRSHFNNTNKPSFKFEKIIGTGARGFAVELRIKDESGPSLTPPLPEGPSLSGPSLSSPSSSGPSSSGPSLSGPLSLLHMIPSYSSRLIGSPAADPLFSKLPPISPVWAVPSRELLLPVAPSLLSGPTPAKKKIERFVMKRAFDRKDDETISREFEFLRRLRGAQNIQQLYRLPNETEDLKLNYLPGPTLFTEWIPNGQIRDLVMTRPDWNHPLPNRMLWRCFLCMCHMLIAMAWPPEGNPNAPSAKPELPPNNSLGVRPQKSTMRHNDINIGNIMFGDFDCMAHRLVPILKLIDFGQASNSTDSFQYTEESAVRQNMLRIAEVMVNLIGGAVTMNPRGIQDMEVTINGEKKTIKSRAKDLDGLSGYGATNAIIQRHKEWLDNLDTDLRDLLVLCLATDENMRPTLEQLYEEVRRNVTEKTRGSYAGKRWQDNESDESLRTISRNLIVNPANKSS